MALELDITPLLDAGFKKLSKADYQALVDDKAAVGMNSGGDYDLAYHLTRGTVSVTIEQNISTIAQDGMETMTKHPPVAKIESPKGAVSCAIDFDLILQLADELA